MRVVQAPIAPSTPDKRSGTDGKGGGGGGGFRDKDAESLFRTKPISEIRNVEATTRKQIQDKSEELRQLVGNRYRDLIDSADSIVLMKSSCESICANILAIHDGILRSLSSTADFAKSTVAPDPARTRIYGIACRVKYLVDTLENIWGCLDESMFLEAAARYIRAKHVHQSLAVIRSSDNRNVLSNFPLLQHQWQIVESFKTQISQRSRERLLDHALGLGIAAYADALAAVVIIDELDPHQVLSLFLDSRKSCISKKLGVCSHDSVTSSDVISVFCEVLKIIQVTIGQVGELFLQVLNDMPLFYKTILGSPPASQLFGGIPNPDEEIRMWNLFRDKLESLIVMLDRNFIAKTCSEWLRNCGKEIVNKINGRYLVDAISSGQQLAEAEKLMRETMESRQVLEGSLEWLKSVFGSEIELPWKRTRELVLGDDSNLWDEIFEDAFVQRMKAIIESGFDELSKVVNVLESVHAIADAPCDRIDFQAYLKRLSSGGGVWFTGPNAKKVGSLSNFKAQLEENDFCSCLNVYFGAEVSRIRDAVDSCCEKMLEDLLRFLESPNASFRLKDLVPYIQNKCYGTLTDILMKLKDELGHLQDCLGKGNENDESMPPLAVIVERSLFIGRLLFAFQKHSRHIPVVLGSPRLWINETMTFVSDNSPILLRSYSRSVTDSPIFDSPGRKMFDSSKRKTSLATSALFGVADSSSPQHEDLSRTIQDLCIRAYDLWILWVSNELVDILSHSLRQDDGLSATTPLRGWEEIVVKQEESDADQTEIKLLLPSIPSLYITSFLFQACEEIHRVGGHILDKSILQNFASTLLEKVIGTYEDFLSSGEDHWLEVSEKGILQILLDLRFVTDVLSGGDFSTKSDTSKVPKMKLPSKQKQVIRQVNSAVRERLDGLVNRLSQRLDPIDWLTYEPYLWENERMSCRRHAVLFGFFVQLNQMYMDNVHKYSAHSNSESNIMRCSTVPRFKYLPISAPVLSSKGSVKISPSASVDDASLRSPWKNYTNDEISRKIDIDEHSSFGVATPFLKSFMQVGRGFGESTLKLGSMLTDGQVGRFGDILPAQAAGLLSSFTTARSDF